MLHTLHLVANEAEDIRIAASLLQTGSLVAFATETVYGLGANALSADAVTRIFAAKDRPSWDPLIVHIASVEQLASVSDVPEELVARVKGLAAAFWPGPLTLLLPRSDSIPDAVTAGRDLVGVRVPAHPSAQALLIAAGLPIAAPSANLFGHTSPTSAAHVFADLDGRIEAVLDAGPTSIGVESTVLDPTRTPMILYRPGAITAEQLTAVTGIEVQAYVGERTQTQPHASLPSPGVGMRHYAPRARMVLVDGTEVALRQALASQPHNGVCGVILPLDWQIPPGVVVQQWAKWDDTDALAATLFSSMRALDDRGVGLMVCPLPPSGGLGDAIRDRLEKAARID
ncbi:MAG: threonylcarbamoyl-AMP synthase [Acidobacteria bacterium]|nr:threonylcarbamoyl-AMP synthase [Acidobacteriota bacterium]